MHVAVVLAMVFFNSPAKGWLLAKQKRRVGRQKGREEETQRRAMGPLGLPDAEEDLEDMKVELEALREIRRKQSI